MTCANIMEQEMIILSKHLVSFPFLLLNLVFYLYVCTVVIMYLDCSFAT